MLAATTNFLSALTLSRRICMLSAGLSCAATGETIQIAITATSADKKGYLSLLFSSHFFFFFPALFGFVQNVRTFSFLCHVSLFRPFRLVYAQASRIALSNDCSSKGFFKVGEGAPLFRPFLPLLGCRGRS